MKILQKISALFLIAVMLLFSFGFTINKMVCLKSGNAKISLNNIKDCCGEKETPVSPVVKTHCCDLSSTAFHLKDYSPSEHHSIPYIADCVLLTHLTVSTPNNGEDNKQILGSSDLPPPLHGKQLLSFISVFII